MSVAQPRRWQLPALEARHSQRLVVGFYMLVNSGLAIAVMAGLALATKEPFAFPSLGPTAFLLFYQPLAPNAAPRSALLGHLIGVLCGYLALLTFGLLHTPPNLEALTWGRVGALAMALGLTLSLMVWLGVPHAPAGATTLIVATGLLRTPLQLAVLMAAVVLLVVQGLVINRLAGVPYPIWKPRPVEEHPGGELADTPS
jgi:CBS domain-containing membrane protein